MQNHDGPVGFDAMRHTLLAPGQCAATVIHRKGTQRLRTGFADGKTPARATAQRLGQR